MHAEHESGFRAIITQVLYITIVDRHFGSNHVQYTYLYYVPINFNV